MSDHSTFIGLLNAHIKRNPDNLSWVPAYHTARPVNRRNMIQNSITTETGTWLNVGGVGGAFSPPKRIFLYKGNWYRTQTIGGHYRRKALYGTLHRALQCVCKYEPLV